MRYVVVTPDGDIHLRDEPGDALTLINRAVGEPGFDIVRLSREVLAGAFVNDCGHLNGLPRNVMGSLILVGLGATALPYAGPVVITGWDPTPGDTSEVRDLTDEQVTALADVHVDLRRCMGLAGGEPTPATARWWAVDGAGYAEFVRTAPAPQPVLLHDEDAIAYLRAMRGAS